jgi:hypothetical protein
MLEQVKIQTGRYPERLDPNWWQGREVPTLIDVRNVYSTKSSKGEERQFYQFEFRVPWAWNGRWHYESALSVWVDYE